MLTVMAIEEELKMHAHQCACNALVQLDLELNMQCKLLESIFSLCN